MTKAEMEARQVAEDTVLRSRAPKKPKLIIQDKAAAKHWTRILQDMDGLEIIDVLDTDALAIYCAKLARRDDLQAQYLRIRADTPDAAVIKLMVNISSELQSIERELLAYASKLGLTPESRIRLAKRLAEQEEYDPDADLFA
jgi:P27 family predicted phage terminase small subunit